MIIGHEFCGDVVEVGRAVTSVSVGQRVSGEGHVVGRPVPQLPGRPATAVYQHSRVGVNRDGAFADYVVIPASNVWVHPAGLDPDLGALFDPLGNATHTALSFPMPGEDVLITGAGPIGVMATAIARHVGAPVHRGDRPDRQPPRLRPDEPVPTSPSTPPVTTCAPR